MTRHKTNHTVFLGSTSNELYECISCGRFFGGGDIADPPTDRHYDNPPDGVCPFCSGLVYEKSMADKINSRRG